jgi:hypothetical protein
LKYSLPLPYENQKESEKIHENARTFGMVQVSNNFKSWMDEFFKSKDEHTNIIYFYR